MTRKGVTGIYSFKCLSPPVDLLGLRDSGFADFASVSAVCTHFLFCNNSCFLFFFDPNIVVCMSCRAEC